MKKNKILICIIFSTISVARLAFAADESNTTPQSAPTLHLAPSELNMTSGIVRKIDAKLNRLTIKHDAITNLDMPGMTMVFRVSKTEILVGLNAADHILFHAESVAGTITITKIEMAP